MTSILDPARVHGVLLDIEGTTTPIAFVHEVLFPYSRSRVSEYLVAQQGSPELAADLASLGREHAADVVQQLQPPPLVNNPPDAELASLVAYLHWLIDRDRKSTALKSLQGRIWRQGYGEGSLQAPVFADVAPALERWKRAGLRVSIFSSGSILAQQLLFAHTECGDLTTFIDDYFDTTSGPKTEAQSYREISLRLRLPVAEILFISDVVLELDAAATAGMQTLLNLRPGNPAQPGPERHQSIHTFEEMLKL